VGLLLFALASLLLLIGGGGVAGLIVPRDHRLHALEWLSLAILCGAGVVSMSSFLLGWLVSGTALRMIVTLICLLLGAAGIRHWRRAGIEMIWPKPASVGDCVLLCLLMLQIGLMVWLSLRFPMAWDGLLNWEIKARLASLNGGVIPTAYFQSKSLFWSHPEYPLLVPLTEAWVYSWLGGYHQGLVKLVFPLFYFAALGLLATGSARIVKEQRTAWLPPLLLFFIPLALTRGGSVTSGYVDFPLAVYYLAAAIWLAEYWQTASPGALRMLGIIGAMLPWLKQEGTILWGCLVILAAIKAVRQRQLLRLWGMVLPGACVLIGWMLFIRFIRAPLGQDYMPLTMATLKSNAGRIPLILRTLLTELVNWRNWGLLWPALLPALSLLGKREQREPTAALFLAIALPLVLFLEIYLFIGTSNKSLENHLDASLPRLMLQVSLVAVLLTGVALSIRRDSAG